MKRAVLSVTVLTLLGVPASWAANTQTKMSSAQVPEAYSCPLFENRPHAELISAIDTLNAQVNASPECTGNPSAKSFGENGETIKKSIVDIQTAIKESKATQVNSAALEKSMTDALAAVGNIGDVINNNEFLNSRCGRQVMSTGKVLLAVNDVVNGLAPYALFAVSMNAALKPALPFVIGGAVATSGISAIAKMIDQNTLDMSKPNHRKALLENVCQFTKIAKKVRFVQLAQSGKIDTITKELEQNVALYNARFGQPSKGLAATLAFKDSTEKYLNGFRTEVSSDKDYLAVLENQVANNADDLLMCSLSIELVKTATSSTVFPMSSFLNLQQLTQDSSKTEKIQAAALMAMNNRAIKSLTDYATGSMDDPASCAKMGKSWLQSIHQALNLSGSVIEKKQSDLDTELAKNAEYRQWKARYSLLQTDIVTVKRVEKAMEELSKDTSIIDRSEFAQRMVALKAGLFGSRFRWNFGKSPVFAWIEHTKSMHDQTIGAFTAGMKALREESLSLTEFGRRLSKKFRIAGVRVEGFNTLDMIYLARDVKVTKGLSNLTLKTLPVGSRDNEVVCQQLESAWLDWSAALDHLGAIQFFCDMIDPVLDVKVDAKIISACRGQGLPETQNGWNGSPSLYEKAKLRLKSNGYQADAQLVSQKLKELQCPMPEISVMK
ncbi:hypothetical protein [Bdellovibrio sp. BCCA]|uniref:hypothetical protein n=1 Tax=Bdellovibrio sp. BCCA TaxID=3136281 RepID=UPI0030F0A426